MLNESFYPKCVFTPVNFSRIYKRQLLFHRISDVFLNSFSDSAEEGEGGGTKHVKD
jgi:hypothetical protein